MSVTVETIAWKASPYVGNLRLIHLALANTADHDGVCWPSHTKLATLAACSTRTVQTAIATLLADGWLELLVTKRRAPKGYSRSVYKLAVPCGQTLSTPEVHQQLSPVSTPEIAGVTPEIYDTTPENHDAHIGEPLVEQSLPIAAVAAEEPSGSSCAQPWGTEAHEISTWVVNERIRRGLPRIPASFGFRGLLKMVQGLAADGHQPKSIAETAAGLDGAWSVPNMLRLMSVARGPVRRGPPEPGRQAQWRPLEVTDAVGYERSVSALGSIRDSLRPKSPNDGAAVVAPEESTV